jgi:hypothetical protein
LQTKTIADFFNDIPLYSWSNGRWLDLRNKGSASNYNGGIDAVSVDAGERRLVADLPLPYACTVVRLGHTGAEAYAVGFRPDAVHSGHGNESFSYIIHRAHDTTEVWRATKSVSASGVPGAVVWVKVQTTFSNPAYHDSDNNRIFPDAVFTGYTVVLPSDCTATVDDELRTAKGTYVIKSIHDLNAVRIALSHKKDLPT